MNGLCSQSAVATEDGKVSERSGCENNEDATESRALSPEQRANLVKALDRLRRLTSGRVDAGVVTCGQGITIHLVERLGDTHVWVFCAHAGELRGVDEVERFVPDEVRSVLGATGFGE
jgi:hypothetical protein